jgi:hypothetical protein
VINWIIIIILIVVGVLAIKMNHLKHRAFIVVLVVFGLFFYISLTFVATQNNLSMNNYDGFIKTIQVYFVWLGNGFQNIKVLTGNAINLDWKAANISLDKNNTITDSKPVVNKQGRPTVKFAKS